MIGDVYMKALLINSSPRTNGCTFTVLTKLKNTLEKEGIDAQTSKCVFDDIVNEVAPKFAEADAFVIGAPVYYASRRAAQFLFLTDCFSAPQKLTKL